MWIKHGAVSTDQKRYLYRADGSTHDGERNGLWIACDGVINTMEKNMGVIRSVQSDADLPTAAGLEWIQAEGLVVSEVRVGSGFLSDRTHDVRITSVTTARRTRRPRRRGSRRRRRRRRGSPPCGRTRRPRWVGARGGSCARV